MNRHSRGFKLLQLAKERAKRSSDPENVFTQQETPTPPKGDSSILQPTTSTPRHSVGNISREEDAKIPLADLSFSSLLNMSFDINDVLGSTVWADALDGNGNGDIMDGTENVDDDGSDVVDDGIKNGVEICDTGSRVTVSEGAENGVVVHDTGNLVLDDHESGGVVDNIEKGVGIQGTENGDIADGIESDVSNSTTGDHVIRVTEGNEIKSNDVRGGSELDGDADGERGHVIDVNVCGTECDDQINNLDVDSGVQGKDANGNTGGGGVDDRGETVDGGEAVHVDEAGVQDQQGDTQNVSVGRKRKADPAKWQKFINKKRREQGLSYSGRKYTDELFKAFENVEKEKRKMGERCSCKKYKCAKISEGEREDVFLKVWDLTWPQKEVFVTSHVVSGDVKQRKVSPGAETFRREKSLKYFLESNSGLVQVCSKMFQATIGLKEWWIRKRLSKGDELAKKMPRESPRKCTLTSFLDSLPKLESHYCRKSSSKVYLEPIFQSMADVFHVYETHCKDKSETPLSRPVFAEEFSRLNMSIFRPRKDQCDICIGYSEKHIDEVAYTRHIQKKDRAQQEKSQDKQSAIDGKCKVITMDLQAVLLCPMLKASALYYRTKLCVHNFTIFDLATHDVMCYVWHEGEGGLSAHEFASMLTDYLEKDLSFDKYIIYSDGCSYQNRNKVMASALSRFSILHGKVVEQKILEKGHTQMEADSVHSVIERKLKNKKIYLPSDYVRVIEEARMNPRPYDVQYLSHDFFLNFEGINTLKSIRPGDKAGDPVVHDIRALRYEPDGSIHFKLMLDDEWAPVPMKRKESTNLINAPVALYVEKPKISKQKYNHLQELKNVIPTDCWGFYDHLKFES